MLSGTSAVDQEFTGELLEGLLRQLNLGEGFEELFQWIYDRFHGVVPYHRAGVALLEDADVLRLVSCRSDGELQLKVGYAAHVAGSTLATLLQTAEPRILNDLEAYLANKPSSSSTQLIVQEGMRSSLTLPLVADGQPIGVVFFSSREKNAYHQQHVGLLQRVAGHIAIALERVRLLDELQSRNQDLAEANKTKDHFLELLQQEVDRQTAELRSSEQRYRSLVHLGQMINASLDVREIFQCAAEQINKISHCDRVSLLLVDEKDEFRHGFAMEFIEGSRMVEIPQRTLAGSAVEWVMERGSPRIARRLDEERLFPEDDLLFGLGFFSYAYVPLVCREQGVGILGLASRNRDEPDRWDFKLLQELCAQLATALDNASAYSEIARLKSRFEEQSIYLRDEIRAEGDFGNIIGNSRAMLQVRQSIRQVAETDSTVLILGETGTGKELIARAIHDSSHRKDHLLVKVNCAALAAGVITSELFGHETGAFTGATQRRQGRFEIADKGSIFLDEVSEIPLETQVMLLRVLQERVVERVGGNDPIPIDVRVITATNRNLKEFTEKGHFRDDLFYRLNVFPIQVPPLRERREDIPALINHFITRFAPRMDKRISRVNRRAMELLMAYDWPGNVRELENIIERAMIISPADTLEIDSRWLSAGEDDSRHPVQPFRSLAENEKSVIMDALERSAGKIYGSGGAAELLEVKPQTLYSKMRKHGIERQRTRYEAPDSD
jgi:formate hydrogenlyase transcriptional activator